MKQPSARRPETGIHPPTAAIDGIGQSPRLAGNDEFADCENRSMTIELASAPLPAPGAGLGEDRR
jgi:hypothetical protein